MSKSQRLTTIENELGALGYSLRREYVIYNDEYIVKTCHTLNDVDKFLGQEELRQMGDGGDIE